MSHKKSASECEKNKDAWTNNSTRFQKAQKKTRSNALRIKIIRRKPQSATKNTNRRTLHISWEEQIKFSHVSDQGMQAKIDKLVKTYDDKCVRKGKYAQNERFDITLWLESLWFSLRNKRLYHDQQRAEKKLDILEINLPIKNLFFLPKDKKNASRITLNIS